MQPAETGRRLQWNKNMKKEKTIIQQQFLETMIALSLLELARGITCIADGIMTSRLVGTDELAAFGLTAPYYSIVAVISVLLTISCQTMYTQNLGKGNLDRANAYLSHAVLYGGIISAALTVLGIVFAGPLCVLFGARGESAFLLPYAKEYLIGLFIGTVGNVMLGILHPIVELDGGGVWTKSANLVMIVVNIVGNYVTTRYMHLGLFGIGISSSLGFFAAVAVLSVHFFTKKCQIRYTLNKTYRIRISEFLQIGFPGAVSMLCRAVCPIIVNGIIVAVASSEGLSAISAQANIKFVISAPLCGISGAVMELGSIAYGERDTKSLREILMLSVKYIYIGVSIFSALIFLCSKVISSCYFPTDSPVYPLAGNAISWYALSLAFTALNLVAISYFQIIGKTRPLLVLYVCSELLAVALFSVIFGSIFGLSGVFAAIAAGPALISVVCAMIFFTHKKNESRFALPYLPSDFGVTAENCLTATFRSMNEVMDGSRQVQTFCLNNGITKRKAFAAVVLIEELAGNVIKHGFTDGKKHQVDIRVVAAGEEVVLKITDNCRRFDFNAKLRALREEENDPNKNLGLKLAVGLTRDITYLNTSNKNILVLTI